jgi:ferritin-like metal-binding protein YciE
MKNNLKHAELKDLFLLKIKALYDIETHLVKALPKMAAHSADKDLKSGFKNHLKETQGQVRRLRNIFFLLGISPQKTQVEAIRGLVKDAEWLIKNIKDTRALDAGLIAAAQYVEHYEIAGYGTALEWAKLLGLEGAARLLKETLREEKAADEKLNRLAKHKVNKQAIRPEE